MPVTYPTGHLPDTPEQRARSKHIGELVGAAPSDYPLALDYRGSMPGVRTQRGNSCVGESIAAAVAGLESLGGGVVSYPSPVAIYTLARRYGDHGAHEALNDAGCSPTLAFDAASKFGLVDLHRWDPENVNEELPFDIFTNGSGALLTGSYRVDDGDISAGLKRSLAAGFLPAFGMPVDQAYFEYAGGVYSACGEPQGGHMQLIVGYEPDYAIVRNHWGAGWGLEGYAQIAWEFIASPACFDRTVITSAPKGIR